MTQTNLTQKPILSQMRAHFNSIYNSSIKKAEKEHIKIMDSLEAKSHFETLYLLAKEEERIKALIDSNDHPYYIDHTSSEDSIFSIFANRALLYQVDDSNELEKAVFLGKYKNLIFEKIYELTDEIPLYTYLDFISGKECIYFNNLRTYNNIPEKDYYQIQEWKSDALINIVAHDYLLLISKIQKVCLKESDPELFIRNILKKFEQIDKSPEDAANIKSRLLQVFGLNKLNIEAFDNELLEKQFKHYLNQEMDWPSVKYTRVSRQLQSIKKHPYKLASDEITVFYVFNKVFDWLERIRDGSPWNQQVREPDYHQHLSEAKASAERTIQKNTDAIELFVYNKSKDNEEIKKYLLKRFDEYREKFNAFEEKYFFQALNEKKANILERMFITNSFFGNAVETQTKKLSEAIIIQETLWIIVQIHNGFFDTHKMDEEEEKEHSIDVLDLATEMAMDKELFKKMHNTLHDVIHQFHYYFLPMEVHFRNQRDAFHSVFEDGLSRLQEKLDNAVSSNRIMYLQSRLKRIKERELEAKLFEIKHHFELRKSAYADIFKEFLKLEAEYMKETIHLPFQLSADLSKELEITQKLLPGDTTEIICTDNMKYIMRLLEELGITNNGNAILSEKKKGAVRGVVEALRETGIVPNIALDKLISYIAGKINLQLKSRLDISNTSEDLRKRTLAFIKLNSLPKKT